MGRDYQILLKSPPPPNLISWIRPCLQMTLKENQPMINFLNFTEQLCS